MGKQKVAVKDIPDLQQRQQISKKKFHVKDLLSFSPTNKQQSFFTLYYQDIPIIIQHGCSGTGKTKSTLHAMFTEVLDPDTPYKRILYVRSAVETRAQGFLPGSLQEKEEIYELPAESVVNSLFKYENSYKTLKELGIVDFCTTSHIRGLTFSDTLVCMDEVQNADYGEIRDILTRMGDNCRLVLCGDVKQDDLKRKRQQSGLAEMMDLLEKMPENAAGFVEYGVEDICRSDIVRAFLTLEYSQ